MGQAEAAIVARMVHSNRAIDDKITGQPEPCEEGGLYWAAFWQLCTCREKERPLSWLLIHTWAVAYGLDQDGESDLEFVIRDLDIVMLAHMRKQRELAEKKAADDKRNGKR